MLMLTDEHTFPSGKSLLWWLRLIELRVELGLKFVAVIIFSMPEVQVFLIIPFIYGEGKISRGLFLMSVPCFALGLSLALFLRSSFAVVSHS